MAAELGFTFTLSLLWRMAPIVMAMSWRAAFATHGGRNTSVDVAATIPVPCADDRSDGCNFLFPTSMAEWGLRDESWVIPLMALSIFNLTVMTFFETFVLVKTVYARPSRRHLFLGQMLLLGLFLSSLLGFAFVTHPNTITCTVVRLGVGLAYALVLVTLSVKCVFLISLNHGVYLPAAYLGLLLFFAIAVQLVVGIQWLVLVPPSLVFDDAISFGSEGLRPPSCNTGFSELLLSLVYVMFLLFFTGVLSIKSCGIRENYREATYIAVTVGLLAILWLTWMVLGLVMGEGFEEPSVAFGLVGGAAVAFLVMFLPKGRQLAALGREGLYVEDREDVASNVTPSGFAPSFYHFTPAFIPVWDNSPNTMYKNTMPDHKCHKLTLPGRIHSCHPSRKLGDFSRIAGRNVSIGPPNIHNSMMY